MNSTENSTNKLWRRRDLIKQLGATAIAGSTILRRTTANAATSKVIKIGHVSAKTGVFAPRAEADPFVLDQIRSALAEGITNNGISCQVQIISKDSQSKTNRAAEVAAELILKDKVDLLLTAGAPDLTNAVADQAEANEVPCITDATPWQPYFFGRHGTPDKDKSSRRRSFPVFLGDFGRLKLPWCDAYDPLEVKAELALVRETGTYRNLGQTDASLSAQELLSPFDAPCYNELVRRQTCSRFKLAQEVIWADANQRSHLFQRRPAVKVGHNVVDNGGELPARKCSVRPT